MEDLAAARLTLEYEEHADGNCDIGITAESPLPLSKPQVIGILWLAMVQAAADGRVVFTEE